MSYGCYVWQPVVITRYSGERKGTSYWCSVWRLGAVTCSSGDHKVHLTDIMAVHGRRPHSIGERNRASVTGAISGHRSLSPALVANETYIVRVFCLSNSGKHKFHLTDIVAGHQQRPLALV